VYIHKRRFYVMSHLHESLHTYEGVTSRIWTGHLVHMNSWCHTCEWDMSPRIVGYRPYIDACSTHDLTWLSQITRVNESCCTHARGIQVLCRSMQHRRLDMLIIGHDPRTPNSTGTSRIHMWYASYWCVTWPVHTWNVTYSYAAWLIVGHDPRTSNNAGTWRFHTWHDLFICVTWSIHMWNVTYSYVAWLIGGHDLHKPNSTGASRIPLWHDSFICVTWLFNTWKVT